MSGVQTVSDRGFCFVQADQDVAASEAPTAQTGVYYVWWQEYEGGVYRCEVRVSTEEDGRESVYAATLPGVVSYGHSEEEAIKNIVEALRGAIETYGELKKPIPWDAEPEPPALGERRLWVTVHV